METLLWSPMGLAISVLSCFIVGIVLFKTQRRAFIHRIQENQERWNGLLKAVEKLTFLGLGVITAKSSLFDTMAWRSDAITLGYATLLGTLCFVIGVGSDWLRERAKDATALKLADLTASKAGLDSLMRRWLLLVALIRKLIESKMERCKRDGVLASVESCEQQIRLIGQSIHTFFEADLHQVAPGASLRMGIYAPNAAGTHLQVLHGWNGHKADCFHSHPDRMRLRTHEGLKSLVTKAYYATGAVAIWVVPDCEADRDFTYFDDDQRRYLKSMLAFKYATHINGTEDAIVLTLDTNRVGYFSKEREDEFQAHLLEMLKRLDFEFSNLAIAKSISDSNHP